MAKPDRTRNPSPPPSRPVAVGYCRKSTERQEASTADQKREIERWASENAHDLCHVFSDDGVSGSKLSRPGLNAMLSLIERAPGGVLVVWKRNRLVRPDDPRDGIELERRIQRAGWRIEYLQGSKSASTGSVLGDLIVDAVDHEANGALLRQISSDSLRGGASAVSEGQTWYGPAPYGFSRQITWPGGVVRVIPRTVNQGSADAESVKLVPGDPREVEVIREIFSRYAAGTPLKVLVTDLARRGIPSARGAHWSPIAMREMLKSPAYVGDLAWNRRSVGRYHCVVAGRVVKREGRGKQQNDQADWVIVRDAHEALISRETFEKVQRIMATRGQAKGGARRAKRFALSGLLKCAACGGSFGGQGTRYQCRGLDPLRECRSNGITCHVIEGAVLRALRESLGPYRSSERLRAALLQELTADQPQAGQCLASSLDREVSELERKITRAYENLGEVTADQAKRLSTTIAVWEARLSEVMSQREAAQAVEAKRVDPAAEVEAALAIMERLDQVDTSDEDQQARRDLFSEAVVSVTLAHESRPSSSGTTMRHIPTLATVAVRGALGALAGGGGSPYLVAGVPGGSIHQIKIPAEWLVNPRRGGKGIPKRRTAAVAARRRSA